MLLIRITASRPIFVKDPPVPKPFAISLTARQFTSRVRTQGRGYSYTGADLAHTGGGYRYFPTQLLNTNPSGITLT
jgi:hypothetical protein